MRNAWNPRGEVRKFRVLKNRFQIMTDPGQAAGFFSSFCFFYRERFQILNTFFALLFFVQGRFFLIRIVLYESGFEIVAGG